ncbi:MAG TPA: aminotransferase class I/II-fold pyridoxal phosphate-dependent enzyme [Tepidisphaeraceae bacterium]|jgi:aspartate aminotransferase/aminotransferase|nr:aminotransferase class I/II-fold pyridoxal phosphate-dependent enzyme [Tepidisphaeraceae bacterium]
MRTPQDYISRRALGVDASGIRKVFDLAAKMKDPINFSIGLPDFDVPDIAKEAAIDAIRAGNNRYTQTQGIAPLRERLRKDLSAEMGRDVGDVLITSGVSGGLLLAILATIDPGDEAIFLDPYFVMYKHLLTVAGGKPVIVNSYPDFRFPAEKVEAAITPRTKLLILNSPSNPTGVVMSEADVKAAVEIAKKHGLLILSDEIYEPFLYGSAESKVLSAEPKSPASDLNSALSTQHSALPTPARLFENTIILRGFSKSHAMTGWRLGYAAGPEAVIAQMTKLQQYTFVCAPTPFQFAALKALDVPMADAVAVYRQKRDLIYAMLSRKFEVVKPEGAFYIFPKAPAEATASDFVTRAIANNVLIIPGNVFSEQDTHFRISYATSDEKIEKGCEILCSLAK